MFGLIEFFILFKIYYRRTLSFYFQKEKKYFKFLWKINLNSKYQTDNRLVACAEICKNDLHIYFPYKYFAVRVLKKQFSNIHCFWGYIIQYTHYITFTRYNPEKKKLFFTNVDLSHHIKMSMIPIDWRKRLLINARFLLKRLLYRICVKL